jgi:hypothetical protein
MLFHSRSIAAGIMGKGRRRNFWVNLIQNKKFPKKKKKEIFRRLGKWQPVSAYNNNMQQPLLQNTDASSAAALL